LKGKNPDRVQAFSGRNREELNLTRVTIEGDSLTITQSSEVVFRNRVVGRSPKAQQRICVAWRLVEHWIEAGETVYGVTKGFTGALL
jgi:histidine ammonia-lyase